jgi:hypothetical protein
MALLAVMAGCGDSGPPRFAVWGDVVWKGAPLPRGVIYFDPDVAKGNNGPQGFTLIVDGKYDTRAASSKGCVPGPHIAIIHGYDGRGIAKSKPYGDELFVAQQLPVTIPTEGGQINLTVPASAPRAPATAPPDF